MLSIAAVMRWEIGASACSVSLNDASVSLPDSAIDFSNAERAKFVCRSIASLRDFTPENALNAFIVSSRLACAVAANCLERSCRPAVQIWLDFTNASTLPWPNATISSVLFIAFSIFILICAGAGADANIVVLVPAILLSSALISVGGAVTDTVGVAVASTGAAWISIVSTSIVSTGVVSTGVISTGVTSTGTV